MLGGELLVSLAQRQRLRRLHETACTFGVFFEIHRIPPRPVPNARCGAVGASFTQYRRPALTGVKNQAETRGPIRHPRAEMWGVAAGR
jgi:hypothetical protein